mmetsp:Transcript_56900/g.120947  ORF Transcript_56900/g.120947 Transcript_56900/m.120947 type:complete len:92 (+) Transcript_56900:223-498(+)
MLAQMSVHVLPGPLLRLSSAMQVSLLTKLKLIVLQGLADFPAVSNGRLLIDDPFALPQWSIMIFSITLLTSHIIVSISNQESEYTCKSRFQ